MGPHAHHLGRLPDRTTREQIVRHAAEWLRAQPQSFRENILDPFAPTKYGTTAKLKTKKGAAEQLAFAASKAMRSAEQTSAPTWAALGRSPEAGRRKRFTTDIVLKCRAGFPQLDIHDNGVVYSGGIEAARYVANMKLGRKRRWKATGVSWQLVEQCRGGENSTGVACDRQAAGDLEPPGAATAEGQ